MATTTTNYGWDIPQSTDLVKDGATAIATLGQDIDTSVYTALGGNKSGLVLLNTTSFSGVASQSINDVFSASYDAYRVIITKSYNSGSAGDLRMRLRVAGSDNSTASSYIRRGYYSAAASLSNTPGVENYFTIGLANTTTSNQTNFGVLEFFSPFDTVYTGLSYHAIGVNGSEMISGAGWHNQTTSYTGFTIFTNAGQNFHGTISTYGFNK
jgi:hypothetical protein